MSGQEERLVAVWLPDWPVVAAMTGGEVPAGTPAAVHDGRVVTGVSAVARSRGVRRGMRRRHAQEVCPELVLLAQDTGRDVRTFEPVAAAVETVVAGVEIARPGLLLLPGAGAGRYHGSEEALGGRLVEAVAERCGHEAQVGVADVTGAAVLAARAGRLVPPGRTAGFLSPLPIGDLPHVVLDPGAVRAVDDLVDLLRRLGLRTMGDLAGLPEKDVLTRFGPVGRWAHRVARGADERPTAVRRPESDLEVQEDLDPPVVRVEGTAFAARRLAESLHALLVARGAACGRLQVTARTGEGRELVRTWRTDAALGGLSAARITDRVRWQLEGWITSGDLRSGGRGGVAGEAADGELCEDADRLALVHLALLALDVAPAGVEQGRLWGDPSGADVRAHRALHRVQGLLGPQGVLAVTVQGGREVRDQVLLTPWGDAPAPARTVAAPWPGRLPSPAPATVLTEPEPADLLDETGMPVQVSVRLALSGSPRTVRTAQDRSSVTAWAGPWPVVQRWWGRAGSRRAYLQVVPEAGPALLLAAEGGRWTVEARYD